MTREAHPPTPTSESVTVSEEATTSRELQLTRQLKIADLILNNIYNGVIVTDAEGYVTHFNEPYGRFLRVDPGEQVGKHATEVIENTRMHIVAQTGKAEINVTQRIRGQDMVVQRIPIRENGKVIAVYGQVMFKNVRDVGNLARKLQLLESKVKLYEKELTSLRSTRYTFESIKGISPPTFALKKQALKAADTNLPVLITGESGTGKELFAQAIHHASRRKLYPFVRINCSAIPRDLFESELFGYEEGAFTGARSGGKPGKFEMGQGGTVFLDEVGDLPKEMQPKLLRVLEEKEFERVGGTSLIKADFRIVAATNQNLEEMLSTRALRKDLFYRLNVIHLHIPPLRERREDVIPLARHLLDRISEDLQAPRMQLAPESEGVLSGYNWPGNVRELSNVIERVLSTLDGQREVVEVSDLPFSLKRSRGEAFGSGELRLDRIMARAEREALTNALGQAKNNKVRAADLLGIHRTLLYKKMKKYGISLS